MLARLDSRSLSQFLAVAEALSFRQAADTLHMSQPPLSRAIRELEERLGVRLFDRHAQGASLTDAGRKLLPFAQKEARLLKDAEAALAGVHPPVRLRLGLTNAVEPAWFDGLVDRIRACLPDASVSATSDSSPRLVRQLRAGRLDAAFVALPTASPGLELQELDRQPMVVALPSGHPLARRRRISLADIVEAPMFWFERARQPAFYDHCERVFARHRFAPRRVKEPGDHHVLLADVAAGHALALLPRSFTRLRRSGVVYRTLAEGDELAVGIGLALPLDRLSLRVLLAGAALAPSRPKA